MTLVGLSARNECHVARVRKQRCVWLSVYKMIAGCVDCGYRDDPRALQFDHVRGEKVANISDLTTASLVRLIVELEKCEVRCANCHMKKTHPNAWVG